MARKAPSNSEIAGILEQMANLLEARKENPFRIQSYRHAAEVIRDTKKSVGRIAKSEGLDGLREIEGVGQKLAGIVQEYVETGGVELLGTLKMEVPEDKVEQVAAKREEEGEEEQKAWEKRRQRPVASNAPVEMILDVDEEYRAKVAEGKLRMIAPKQFNPEGKAWLPVMGTARDEYKFTAMFSNTEWAHRLGKTNDWVVIYYKLEGTGELQCTVVTEQRGPLTGKRVVRGREEECAKHYGIEMKGKKR